jgi:hypothetical protein
MSPLPSSAPGTVGRSKQLSTATWPCVCVTPIRVTVDPWPLRSEFGEREHRRPVSAQLLAGRAKSASTDASGRLDPPVQPGAGPRAETHACGEYEVPVDECMRHLLDCERGNRLERLDAVGGVPELTPLLADARAGCVALAQQRRGKLPHVARPAVPSFLRRDSRPMPDMVDEALDIRRVGRTCRSAVGAWVAVAVRTRGRRLLR